MTSAPLATSAAKRARARILELARQGPADPDFLFEVSQQLKVVVPFTASFWSASDPATTLAISPARVEHLENQCERWWEREFLVQDFNLFRDLARAERPVASLFGTTAGQPMRSVRYRELRDDLGYGDELRGVFRSGAATWGLVSLWREEGQTPFSALEAQLLADLSGPLAEAFRRATLLQASASGAAEAPGLLVFDEHGRLESYNDQAEDWLSELPPPAMIGQHGRVMPLPVEIRSVVGLAHAIANGIEQGVARAHVRSRSGRWLLVHGFPMRQPHDAKPRTAVVIEPAKALEVAPIIVEAYSLGPREQQITQMIARGCSTAEMARELFLSPHTVRDYVKSVFEKVGVSSRGELVARLFTEHYWTPLLDSVGHAPAGEA